jgi:hypothetical protein
MLDMSKMPDEERFRCAAMRTNPRPATIATLALAFDGGLLSAKIRNNCSMMIL